MRQFDTFNYQTYSFATTEGWTDVVVAAVSPNCIGGSR